MGKKDGKWKENRIFPLSNRKMETTKMEMKLKDIKEKRRKMKTKAKEGRIESWQTIRKRD